MARFENAEHVKRARRSILHAMVSLEEFQNDQADMEDCTENDMKKHNIVEKALNNLNRIHGNLADLQGANLQGADLQLNEEVDGFDLIDYT